MVLLKCHGYVNEMNNHFCVLVLFDYLGDVDHESESNK